MKLFTTISNALASIISTSEKAVTKALPSTGKAVFHAVDSVATIAEETHAGILRDHFVAMEQHKKDMSKPHYDQMLERLKY